MKGPLRVRIPRPRRSPRTAGRLSGAVLALGFGTLAAADTKIYRYEDAQGVTVFADRPGSVPQEVALAGVNRYTPAEPQTSVSAPPPADVTESYRSLIVTGPGDGETIRRNGGNVRVSGRVEPALREGHGAVLLVDGVMASRESLQGPVRLPAETHGDIEFTLEGVARGPHTVRIAIVDRGNNVLVESSPVSFHLLRAATGPGR